MATSHMPNGMMKYVPSCHPMEKPNDLEAGRRICCHPIQMSGQGIVRKAPIVFDTAFMRLFKCAILAHGSVTYFTGLMCDHL